MRLDNIRIVARIDKTNLIGYNDRNGIHLPWKNHDANRWFLEKTNNDSTIVVSEKCLPYVSHRESCIAVIKNEDDVGKVLEEAESNEDMLYYICGGSKVFQAFLPFTKHIDLVIVRNTPYVPKHGTPIYFPTVEGNWDTVGLKMLPNSSATEVVLKYVPPIDVSEKSE
jgi:dihydrofolate reductase